MCFEQSTMCNMHARNWALHYILCLFLPLYFNFVQQSIISACLMFCLSLAPSTVEALPQLVLCIPLCNTALSAWDFAPCTLFCMVSFFCSPLFRDVQHCIISFCTWLFVQHCIICLPCVLAISPFELYLVLFLLFALEFLHQTFVQNCIISFLH